MSTSYSPETALAGGVIPTWTMSDRLRKSREITGLSQGQFAKQIDISPRTVSNYEAGAVEPRTIVVKQWALRAGVNFEWLQTGNEKTPPPEGDGVGVPERPRRGSNPRPTAYNVAVLGHPKPSQLAA